MHLGGSLLVSRPLIQHGLSTSSRPLLCASSVWLQRRPAWQAQRNQHHLLDWPHRHNDILSRIYEFTEQFKLSAFRSRSINPYYNLAIETYLLKYSHPESRILFTYVNRPCVVVGRNQNPWLECNIAKVQEGLPWNRADWRDGCAIISKPTQGPLTKDDKDANIPLDLVRRRSGGGTVIHDAGNLNFSFIVPNDKDFTRDKHAQLVVDLLKSYVRRINFSEKALPMPNFTEEQISVNERHDIVVNHEPCRDLETLYDRRGDSRKVSGSAYKLTRGRALHHGTLLLASPNISPSGKVLEGQSTFNTLLSSPARRFLDAKGVGSVPSPVQNLFEMPPADKTDGMKRWELFKEIADGLERNWGHTKAPTIFVDEKHIAPEYCELLHKEANELMNVGWKYLQTPTFKYTSKHEGGVNVGFEVKLGRIENPKIWSTGAKKISAIESLIFSKLDGQALHEVQHWERYVPSRFRTGGSTNWGPLGEDLVRESLLDHLEKVFPRIDLAQWEIDASEAVKKTAEKSIVKKDTDVSTVGNANTAIEASSGGDEIKPSAPILQNSESGAEVSVFSDSIGNEVLVRKGKQGNIEIEKQGENTVVER